MSVWWLKVKQIQLEQLQKVERYYKCLDYLFIYY